jgi:hypothetical protein
MTGGRVHGQGERSLGEPVGRIPSGSGWPALVRAAVDIVEQRDGSTIIETYSAELAKWQRVGTVASERLTAPAGAAVSVTGAVAAGTVDAAKGTAVVGWGRRRISLFAVDGQRSVATGDYCGVGAAGVWTGKSLIAWGGQECSAGAGQAATGISATISRSS